AQVPKHDNIAVTLLFHGVALSPFPLRRRLVPLCPLRRAKAPPPAGRAGRGGAPCVRAQVTALFLFLFLFPIPAPQAARQSPTTAHTAPRAASRGRPGAASAQRASHSRSCCAPSPL